MAMAATGRECRRPLRISLHHPGGYRRVRYGVDQDEASGVTVRGIGVQKQRPGGLHFHYADAVEFERGGRLVIERLHVHPMADRPHPGLDRLRGMLQEIALARIERLGIHPDQGSEKVCRDCRRLVRSGEHFSPADVQLILERDARSTWAPRPGPDRRRRW